MTFCLDTPPHDRSYRFYNFETNTVIESYDMTFDETTPYPRGVFECAGDKEMEKMIFIDERLQGVDGDEDEPLLLSTPSPEHVPASTLEVEAPQATTSSTTAAEASWVEGGASPSRELPLTFRRYIHFNRS
jgi:hypothetical protein